MMPNDSSTAETKIVYTQVSSFYFIGHLLVGQTQQSGSKSIQEVPKIFSLWSTI